MIDVPPGDRLLTIRQVIAWFAVRGKTVSRRAIRQWIARGHLEWGRVGRVVCTTEAALRRFLNRGQEAAGPPRGQGETVRRKQPRRDREAEDRAVAYLREQGVLG